MTEQPSKKPMANDDLGVALEVNTIHEFVEIGFNDHNQLTLTVKSANGQRSERPLKRKHARQFAVALLQVVEQ